MRWKTLSCHTETIRHIYSPTTRAFSHIHIRAPAPIPCMTSIWKPYSASASMYLAQAQCGSRRGVRTDIQHMEAHYCSVARSTQVSVRAICRAVQYKRSVLTGKSCVGAFERFICIWKPQGSISILLSAVKEYHFSGCSFEACCVNIVLLHVALILAK